MTPFTALIIAGLTFVCGYTLGYHNGSERATRDVLRRIGKLSREKARNDYAS